MYFKKQVKRYYSKLLNTILTRKSKDGVEYVLKQHSSSTLLIVFSGIGEARYNYMRSLSASPCDQLYIRDCWANHTSYYWFERQSDYPERFTTKLIEDILSRHTYMQIITIGSSKGGTAAIYYGLKLRASAIFAGACQYLVGQYLSVHQYTKHPEYWQAVVGEDITKEWVERLDNKLENMIRQHTGCSTRLFLLYSTNEHTYEDHIKPLLAVLDECNILHEDQIEHFPEHSMVGDYFKVMLSKRFAKFPTK